MSSPIHSYAQVAPIIHSPAPMPSGMSLTVSTTTATNHHDPSNLRRQATPVAPAPRVPVETRKIVKTQDSNNPTWKMLNQYRVMRLLGRGTHGIVKYGEDMSKDDPNAPNYAVAIKIIKRVPNRKRLPRADGRDHTNSVLGRIKYEVAVMKRCHHDHIVSLIEVIDDPRSHSVFLVMEYLEGGEIKWRGPDKPLLTLEQIRRIVRDVLLGLEYLHYMGVIHRDIKPANMLWTKGRARVKLTDFGVAHFSKPLTANYSPDDNPYLDKDDRLNKTEGTPAFYAPEQACNQNGTPVPTFPPGERPPGVKGNQIYPMTKALDIWAFGVSIYCFLFGHPPYWGPNVYALCNEILETDYEVPTLATADALPVDSDNANMQEAMRLMKGMMTKPVYKRMTLAQAKRSPWLTGDLEDPEAWLRETDPEAKESFIMQEHEHEDAVAPKNHVTRVSSIMHALFIRKENSRRRRDAKAKGQSQISLEHSTHRPLPAKPRSLYRPSADQPSSPIDPLSAVSTASSPTGTSHFGDSYFGRSAGSSSTGRTGGISRMVSTLFRSSRRSKKSTSAEAIMTAPAPITPIIPRQIHDLSAPSSPPNGMSIHHHRQQYNPEETELDPNLITYSSDEDTDEDDFGEGEVDLLGYGGYGGSESQHFKSNGRSPSEGSQLISKFNPNHSVMSTNPVHRLSTTTSDPLNIQRVYDPLYSQHTNADDYRDDTITSQPSSPRQETVYIPSASNAPLPPKRLVQNNRRVEVLSEDSDDEADGALEMGPRRRHHET